jgi:hypothetical protein
MRNLSGEGKRVMTPLQSLVRIAQQPQGSGQISEVHDPGVLPIEEALCVMLLRIIEGQAPL